MSIKTDPHSSAGTEPDGGTPAPSIRRRKPHLTLLMATACGLGYIPFAPGTFGSIAGLLLAFLPWWAAELGLSVLSAESGGVNFFVGRVDPFLIAQIALAAIVAVLGVWSAHRVARLAHQKDPQHVVIDEVSGQHLTLLLGCAVPVWRGAVQEPWGASPLGLMTLHSALNWKYLLLGFILFRVFDIWKPFPERQAESLPGGWGIMADDWFAGIYAGIGLWIARTAGL
jgi:phosphatidylglycerophosphatase A